MILRKRFADSVASISLHGRFILETPIDGGVFDTTSTDEVIIPINAKLFVQDAFMFAVTIEKPRGMVMSSRERLPLLAMVE